MGGWTALGLAAGSQPKTVHLLLQAGVKVEGFPKDFRHPFTCATMIRHGRHAARNKPKRLATALMLLACGVEPYFHHSFTDSQLKAQITDHALSWLAALTCAKTLFTKIFDDANLEKTLADFVYNEQFLRQLMN